YHALTRAGPVDLTCRAVRRYATRFHRLCRYLLSHLLRKHFPGADEITDRPRFHLAHHAAAMELHGDHADAEIVGDLLVEPAERDRAHHLALARRKARLVFDEAAHDPRFDALRDIALDPGRNGIEQGLVAHRLGEEIDRARLHRLDGHRNIAMAGQEHDRLGIVVRHQLLLEVEPAPARHAYVEHHAAGAIGKLRFHQLAHRSEACGL